MESNLKASFVQFDSQVNDPQREFIKLNNLFLAVERGDVEMNREVGNQLWNHLRAAYPKHDFVRKYWEGELEQLPGWNQW